MFFFNAGGERNEEPDDSNATGLPEAYRGRAGKRGRVR
jgi:hypothetical protein